MIQNDYLPSIDPNRMCDALQMCSVRKLGDQYMIAVRPKNGDIYQIDYADIVSTDMYDGAPIRRSYSSGHIFLDPNMQKVFLVTVQKDGQNPSAQFTGGDPIESVNQNIIIQNGSTIYMNLDKIEDNAILRTKLRTRVTVTSHHNDIPLVDRILSENVSSIGERYWRLICLAHYIVRDYEGNLGYIYGAEGVVIDAKRYNVSDIYSRSIDYLAPNIDIVTRAAIDFLIHKNIKNN